ASARKPRVSALSDSGYARCLAFVARIEMSFGDLGEQLCHAVLPPDSKVILRVASTCSTSVLRDPSRSKTHRTTATRCQANLIGRAPFAQHVTCRIALVSSGS